MTAERGAIIAPVAITLPFVCPICHTRSWHPRDAEERYCARCHRFVDDPPMPPGLEHALAELEQAGDELRGEIDRQRALDATPPPRGR